MELKYFKGNCSRFCFFFLLDICYYSYFYSYFSFLFLFLHYYYHNSSSSLDLTQIATGTTEYVLTAQ